MSFAVSLKDVAEDIDRLLGELLRPEAASAPRVVEAMRYAALAQGKRLRPFFLAESARLLGAAREHALRAGAALECVHCYSLVHDDLPAMDDDDLRRGRPTCHKAFDEATAILAGDGLLTLAFEIVSDPLTHPEPAVRSQLVLELARAAGYAGMVGGQMLDLEAEAGGCRDIEAIVRLQSMKTGALFRYAVEAGAILAKKDGEVRAALRTYADKAGLAFQIADDILDVESTPEQLGKATQKDQGAGKATFIDLLGLERARLKARQLVDEASAALDRFGPAADRLREAARFIIERQN
jgi:farnesyl diphosphate synthase